MEIRQLFASKKYLLSGLGLLTLLMAVGITGLAVWRVQNPNLTVTRPKATSPYSCSQLGSNAPLSRTQQNSSDSWDVNKTYSPNTTINLGCLYNGASGVGVVGDAGITVLPANGGNSIFTSNGGLVTGWSVPVSGNYTLECSCGLFGTSQANFIIGGGGGGGSCTQINSSVSTNTVAPSANMSFSFSSNFAYSNVGFNPGGGASCGGVNVTGSGPYTWTWSCTASGTAGSYTGTFSNSQSCSASVNYTVAGGNNATSNYVAVAPSGMIGTLTPTFVWVNPTGVSNTVSNLDVFNGSGCQEPIRNYNAPGISDTSKAWSAFAAQGSAPLQANTTYSWLIYGAPTPVGSSCLAFTTPVCDPNSGQTNCNGTCRNTSNDTNNCGACGNVCNSGWTCSGGTCQAPQAPATHFACVNKTCQAVTGAGNNLNGCASSGGTCCGSATDCSSGQTCQTTTTPNTCSGTSEVLTCQKNGGVNGKCYDCNGDGYVNMLDFSCFLNKYGATVNRS